MLILKISHQINTNKHLKTIFNKTKYVSSSINEKHLTNLNIFANVKLVSKIKVEINQHKRALYAMTEDTKKIPGGSFKSLSKSQAENLTNGFSKFDTIGHRQPKIMSTFLIIS